MDCDLCLLGDVQVKGAHKCPTCSKRLCKPCVLSLLCTAATKDFTLTDALDDILRRQRDYLPTLAETLCQRDVRCPFCSAEFRVKGAPFSKWVTRRFDLPSLRPLHMMNWCVARNQSWFIYGFTVLAQLDQHKIRRLTKCVKLLRRRNAKLNFARKRLALQLQQQQQLPEETN